MFAACRWAARKWRITADTVRPWPFDVVKGALGLSPLRRRLVDHVKRARVSGYLQKVGLFSDRFKGKQVWLDRKQHNVGTSSGFGSLGR
jgi:hypothetical protein